MVRGFIVNKFRGDPALFADGMAMIAAATGWHALGLVPFFAEPRLLPAEDALGLSSKRSRSRKGAKVEDRRADPAAVSPISTISIRSTPSRRSSSMRVWPGTALPGDADLVILPGSKSTIADLAALREAGFDIDIAAHLRRGGHVLGLCGGYQMLGRAVARSRTASKGRPASVDGLGLLDVETRLTAEKRLVAVSGATADGEPFSGYEMHMGVTEGPDRRAAVRATRRRLVGRRGLGRRPGERNLYPRAVCQRPPARGLVGAVRRRRGGRLRCAGRRDARSLAAHLAAHVDLEAVLGVSAVTSKLPGARSGASARGQIDRPKSSIGRRYELGDGLENGTEFHAELGLRDGLRMGPCDKEQANRKKHSRLVQRAQRRCSWTHM